MSTTLITTQAELQAWANNPSGTGQLQNDIDIIDSSWTMPTNVITAGMVFDGNNKTIYLASNVTPVSSNGFPGFFKLDGGTIRNLKISRRSGNASATGYIRPRNYCGYLVSNISGALTTRTGIIQNVWLDFCAANKMGMFPYPGYGNVTEPGAFASQLAAYTYIDCQLGRDADNPFPIYMSGNGANIIRPGIFAAGDSFSQVSVSNCVVYVGMLLHPDYPTSQPSIGFPGVLGGSWGANGAGCTVDGLIVYYKYMVSLTSSAEALKTGILTSRGDCQGTVSNSYFWVDWGTSSANRHSLGFAKTGTTNNIAFSNIYMLVNVISGGSITAGNEPYFAYTAGGNVNITNFAYPSNVSLGNDSGSLTTSNLLATYTSSTSNATEPIASFPTASWNLSYTPPLLKFNSTGNWFPDYYVYNNLNKLQAGTNWITDQATLLTWVQQSDINIFTSARLQNDITIDVATWNPNITDDIPAGVEFDGGFKTITLSNTTGSEKRCYGLFGLDGGTIKNFKLTANGNSTAATRIRPYASSSILIRRNQTIFRSGTISNVFIDACRANGFYCYEPTINLGNSYDRSYLVAYGPHKYTINDCQFGRSKDDPYAIEMNSSRTFGCGVLCQDMCQANLNRCVFFIETVGTYSSPSFSGILGGAWGMQTPACSANQIIVYWKNQLKATTAANNNYICPIARASGANASLNNSYIYIDWDVTPNGRQSVCFGRYDSAPGCPTASNVYVTLNVLNGNTIASGLEPVFLYTTLAKTITNIAIPSNTVFNQLLGSSPLTLTNCMNTYSTSTPNTDEPIASFSNTVWNKTVQPPLLAFNSTTPWDSTNAVYDSPNYLTAFPVTSGGGGGGGGVICYGRGTRILMADGTEKNVEDIRQGDLVHTHKHGPKEVTMTYASEYYNNPKLWYRCMFENASSGLRITGSHRVAVRSLADWQMKTYESTGLPLQRLDDEYILLHSTVAVDQFKPIRSSNKFDIFHFALSDEPDEIFGVFANGVLTESVPKRLIEEEVNTTPIAQNLTNLPEVEQVSN